MWKKVAVVGLVLALAFVVVVATRPSSFRIERSLAMNAPTDVTFGLVNDFHEWAAWSPWEKLDPALKKTYSGAEAGEGAVYSWVGNDDVGEGRMTIVSSQVPSRVDVKLEFLAPWEATNQTLFTFSPDGEGTKVTWAMEGENDFAGKAMSLFMDMDSMVGKDFERGLASMKQLAEQKALAVLKQKAAEASAAEEAEAKTREAQEAAQAGEAAAAGDD
jgi:hypothetical protein